MKVLNRKEFLNENDCVTNARDEFLFYSHFLTGEKYEFLFQMLSSRFFNVQPMTFKKLHASRP